MIETGLKELDNLIQGYKDELNLIYGVPGSGKTTLCKLAAINLLKRKKKVVYIDTENGFSLDRFKQLAGQDFINFFDFLILIKVNNFEDQCKQIEGLKELKKVSLVIIDSIGRFFRIKVKESPKEINKEFVNTLNILRTISKSDIPVIITSQVYNNINDNSIVPVGGEIIKRFCKRIIKLQDKPRKLIQIKPDNKEILFEIVEEGIKSL